MAEQASMCSVALPLSGALSALALGAASDRFGGGGARRKALMAPALLLAAGVLGVLCALLVAKGWVSGEGDRQTALLSLPAVMVILVVAGAGVQGPYSMLTALSIDMLALHLPHAI